MCIYVYIPYIYYMSYLYIKKIVSTKSLSKLIYAVQSIIFTTFLCNIIYIISSTILRYIIIHLY